MNVAMYYSNIAIHYISELKCTAPIGENALGSDNVSICGSQPHLNETLDVIMQDDAWREFIMTKAC